MQNSTIFSTLIEERAQKYGQKIAFADRERSTDKWTFINWNELDNKVKTLANALLSLGVNIDEKVGQFSQNKHQNLVVDFALYAIRGVNVPIYATSTASQLEFIVNNAEINLLFVGSQIQYDVACEVQSTSKYLKKIVIFDENVDISENKNAFYFSGLLERGSTEEWVRERQKRTQESNDSDLACLLYTSGTTGNPKGVMLTHGMFRAAMKTHLKRLDTVSDKDVSLAFLPLTHVFERMWCYFMIFSGATIYINHIPQEVQQTLKEVRPTLMCAVPRFWEKVYVGIQKTMEQQSPIIHGILSWGIEIGRKYNLDYLRQQKKPNWWLSLRYQIAEKLIFAKIRSTLGIENANILPSAGAKMNNNLIIFFRSMGIPIVYGYGLTETSATVSCFTNYGYTIGTVGKIVPNVEIKIDENNEILLKGATITPGYYCNDKANKESFTDDGWFRTGDAGTMQGEEIILTERLKDLFKTSNGKYIAPQEIETRLGTDKYIEQVATIGDERNYVTAIITPSIPLLEEYAQQQGIAYESTRELLENKQIYHFLEKRIAKLQEGQAGYELIKKFTLISKAFSIEAGELTNTLKIRRAVIMQHYKSIIDKMYQ